MFEILFCYWKQWRTNLIKTDYIYKKISQFYIFVVDILYLLCITLYLNK